MFSPLSLEFVVAEHEVLSHWDGLLTDGDAH
jgi:hypothetical protein